MARRMFSDEITTSDAFLDMPAESQNLYFHIGMGADDDGFISNTKMIQRAVNASDDALKLLFVKKFLIQFANGICVVKGWRINNYIRKDIYCETKYTKEKSLLFIRKNGAYTLNPKDALPVPKGHFTLDKIEENNTSTLRIRGVDIGKVRIGKVSKEIEIILPPFLNKDKWNEWLIHRKALRKPMPNSTIQKQINFLEAHAKDHIKIIDRSILNGWTGLFELPADFKKAKSDAEKILEKQKEEREEKKEREDNLKDNEKARILLDQSKILADKMKV